jgi:hypothetical protein
VNLLQLANDFIKVSLDFCLYCTGLVHTQVNPEMMLLPTVVSLTSCS